MTKYLFPLSMALAMALTGCGSESDSDNDSAAATVTYDTQGAYDLKDYLKPTSDAQTYSDVWYGDSYFDESISKSSYQEVQYTSMAQTGTSTYKVTTLDYIGDSTPEIDMIEETKIISYDEDDEETEIARHVDIGDLIVSNNYTESFGGDTTDYTYTENGTIRCTLVSHDDSVTLSPDGGTTNYTYSDVLKITCVAESTWTYQDSEGTESGAYYDSWDTYLAKDLGEVAFIDDTCYDEEWNANDRLSTCTNEDQEHTYLNLDDSLFDQ